MPADVEMQDADAAKEEQLQYGHGALTEEELDEKYPNRPHNISKTLPFHELFTTLFNPLNDNRKKPTGPAISRKKQGPHGPAKLSPNEMRRDIIERFISRWRQEVGNDIYPAFRLMVPEKDRDRAMYGLKEKTIGKLLVRVIGINKNSEDAFNLMNWKLPTFKASTSAGDFAGRCFEVLSKRPIRTKVGSLTIAEVNIMLDKLSIASKEEDQYPLFDHFYRSMNAEELMWLIRIILRQMKVGATERTFFDIWHPDAESLFNVSSSLRRVCWELSDPNVRLHSDQSEISLMQCFQPQLAAFQMNSFETIVAKMKPAENEDTFWIEEKLDGERMQLHMMQDQSTPGGMRFAFWSRKAKDYTYLYGEGFEDENSALTRHLKHAFSDSVRNIILDGEMITWDMEEDKMVPFGTLKTAALSEQRNPHSGGSRPLYKAFDCLYVNDKPITKYTLRDRRKALEASVKSINRRLEIHEFKEAHKASDIEPMLRQVVAEASEGLVIKSPGSMYRLNERNDDWIKVKPEYMTEFGEDLDCVIVGGYFGSGRRGGTISSFMCGLRVNDSHIKQGANPQKTYSFFKVGGGLGANDYAEIRHITDGKWKDWDPKKPPTDYLELAGGDRQFERPDVWIKPEDSVVVSVKGASVGTTDQFRMGLTLRFPRFKKLRRDKDWHAALSINDFLELKRNAEKQQQEKKFEIDNERKKRRAGISKRKKPLTIAGAEDGESVNQYAGPDTQLFDGLTFFVISDSTEMKKSKPELEQMIKANGGMIVQTLVGKETFICIGEKKNLKARSIEKAGDRNIVKPQWLLDCIEQNKSDEGLRKFLLPFEPRHMHFTTKGDVAMIAANVDEFGDSYCHDVNVSRLKTIFSKMPKPADRLDRNSFFGQLTERGINLDEFPGVMFRHATVYFDKIPGSDDFDLDLGQQIVRFASGKVVDNLENPKITHIVVGNDLSGLKQLRLAISKRSPVPRIVTADWVHASWKDQTVLDEERFVPQQTHHV